MSTAALQHSSAQTSRSFLDDTAVRICIHCGLCLASCPTYLETGNENDSPRGRVYIMRAVQNGRLTLGNTAVSHIDLCLGCRTCEAGCPSGVQYGELLEATRDHIEKHYRRSLFQNLLRRAIEQIFPFPWRMKLALAPLKPIRALGLEKLMPKFVRDSMSLIPETWSSTPLPEFSPSQCSPLDAQPFDKTSASSVEPLRAGCSTRNARNPRAGFVSGCVMSVLFGDTNANSVRLLNRAGYDVVTPLDQGCCGALYAHTGNLERARACARHNIEVFEKSGVDLVIISASGCGSTLKEYGALLRDEPQWRERAEVFSKKVKDLVEVLHPSSFIIHPSEDSTTRTTTRTSTIPKALRHLGTQALVTYHDACHLAQTQHITKPPRELVRAVAGKNFVELPESDVCCGSAGSYNLTEPEMAERLQQRKIENILATGAKIVVTTNPGCLLQIRAGLHKAGATQVKVLHIADFLAEAMSA